MLTTDRANLFTGSNYNFMHKIKSVTVSYACVHTATGSYSTIQLHMYVELPHAVLLKCVHYKILACDYSHCSVHPFIPPFPF